MSPLVLVDVDLTIVDTGTAWLRWVNDLLGGNYTGESIGWVYECADFFVPLFREKFGDSVKPTDFWNIYDLYDNLNPYSHVYNELSILRDSGYRIVFVSHVQTHHFVSKRNFIQKHFGSIADDFVTARRKYLLSSGTGLDVMIDDRLEFINDSICSTNILWDTNWLQTVPVLKPITTISSWKGASEIVLCRTGQSPVVNTNYRVSDALCLNNRR